MSSQCDELSTAPHIGPTNDGERPHTAIDRRTLRQILAGRLRDVVHGDQIVTGFQSDGDRVRLLLEGGKIVEGDVLVGADGVQSAVRRTRLPDVAILDDGVRGLGLFARTPLTPEIHDQLPGILLDGFVIAVDTATGVTLALGAMDPRETVDEAAARIAPDVHVDRVEPYLMLSGAVPPGRPIPPPGEWTAHTPREMHEQMIAAVDGWHPALRGLVQRIDRSTLFAAVFKRLDPTPPWEPSNVTLVGDAIHAMLPTLGMGGNTSLRDAAALARKLADASHGGAELLTAIGEYEQDMRDYVYPIMEMSADHDRFGGGGLRQAPGR